MSQMPVALPWNGPSTGIRSMKYGRLVRGTSLTYKFLKGPGEQASWWPKSPWGRLDHHS